jgi:hypothetical protein
MLTWHMDDDDLVLTCAWCGMEMTWHKWNGTYAPPTWPLCPTDARGAWVQWDHHFLCGSTWELHIPIAPMDVPTWEHDVSPMECDVNRGGESGGDGKLMPLLVIVMSSNMNVVVSSNWSIVDISDISHGVTHATWYWQIISIGSSYGI